MINATGNRMIFEIARQSRLAKAVELTQIAISTGSRIQRPSDDPAATVRIATIRRAQSDHNVFKRNVDLGSSLTSQANNVLQHLSERLARVQELTIQGSTGALSQTGRDTIAAEVRAIAEDIDRLEQTQSSLGQPLFSTGVPRAMRFADGVVFAPVPSRAEVFHYQAQPISAHLQGIADAISGGDRTALDAALDTADGMVRHGADAAASIGTSAARLDRLADAHAGHSIDLKVERSTLEDTDLTTAIATLNAQQLTLEAAQAAFARINRRSLIDLLS